MNRRDFLSQSIGAGALSIIPLRSESFITPIRREPIIIPDPLQHLWDSLDRNWKPHYHLYIQTKKGSLPKNEWNTVSVGTDLGSMTNKNVIQTRIYKFQYSMKNRYNYKLKLTDFDFFYLIKHEHYNELIPV